MGEKPIGERVAALEAIIPEIKEDLKEIKGSLDGLNDEMKALRNGRAFKIAAAETLRLIAAVLGGIFGARTGGQ